MAGPYDLGSVAFRVLPGEGGELLIGRADMDRIGIATPEEALADVVRAKAAATAAGTPGAGPPQPVRTENLAVAAL